MTSKRHGAVTDFESFLTREALVDLLSYDPATGDFHWRVSLRGPVKKGDLAGHINKTDGRRYITILQRSFQASRLAWLYMKGK
jgi:hypothetical protein